VKIEKGKRVRAKVKLQVVGGDVVEQSVVEYFQGAGTMLAGLEKALDGKEAGAVLEGKLKPDEAFGNPETQVKKTALRTEFPADAKLEVGSEFAAKGANGQAVVLVVEAVSEKSVEVKLMHTLARKEISYEVEVLSVTDPTPPPIPGAILKDDVEDDAAAESESEKSSS
jgi:FKBP-type peptidyl-prolyl cis-trans isomerase SlyD